MGNLKSYLYLRVSELSQSGLTWYSFELLEGNVILPELQLELKTLNSQCSQEVSLTIRSTVSTNWFHFPHQGGILQEPQTNGSLEFNLFSF